MKFVLTGGLLGIVTVTFAYSILQYVTGSDIALSDSTTDAVSLFGRSLGIVILYAIFGLGFGWLIERTQHNRSQRKSK